MSNTAQDPATATKASDLPFWNVNLPSHVHTQTCPDYLAYALQNSKDRQILSTPDALYVRQTWQDVTNLIHSNRLDAFQRVPSDLRRYREYCAKLTSDYGSVMAFVMRERLKWDDLTPKGQPFEHKDDLKILLNDWPYGLDPRIVHLVIWTKFLLPVDPASALGDMTPETRESINKFVDERFVKHCGKENVLWFKNWASLKSIHAVEHFHVLLFDPPRGFVEKVTGGDVALAEKVGKPT